MQAVLCWQRGSSSFISGSQVFKKKLEIGMAETNYLTFFLYYLSQVENTYQSTRYV